jgi:hypothetical protein
MRTSAAIIASFAALAASAPLQSVSLPVAGSATVPEVGLPAVPVVGGLVDGLVTLPKVDVKRAVADVENVNVEETLQNAIQILNGMLAEHQASKRNIDVPVVSTNNIADNLNVAPTVNGVLGNVGGVLKRDGINVPVVRSPIRNSYFAYTNSSRAPETPSLTASTSPPSSVT